jgi:hypothetical protein
MEIQQTVPILHMFVEYMLCLLMRLRWSHWGKVSLITCNPNRGGGNSANATYAYFGHQSKAQGLNRSRLERVDLQILKTTNSGTILLH